MPFAKCKYREKPYPIADLATGVTMVLLEEVCYVDDPAKRLSDGLLNSAENIC